MLYKTTPTYVHPDPNFKPLPKYGHLSQPTPEYTAAESAIDAGYSPLWSAPDWPTFRELAGDADAAMPPGAPDRYRDVVTELIKFPARDGEMIELKIYKSPNVLPDATLMYRMHGGGWVVGRHEVDGAENVYAASNPNIIVVSIDYRKAPEHPFPQALHDSYDGLLWCKSNAKSLGIDPEKIILSGSSAGANLASTLTLTTLHNSISGIKAVVLHFPILCHPNLFPTSHHELGSYIQNYHNPVLSTLRMEAFLDAYIPNAKPDWRHSPLLASEELLRGFPPTLIQSAGIDIFRDEAFAFASTLQSLHVKNEINCYPGLPHCFPAILTTIPQTSVFYQKYCEFLERHVN